MKVFNKNVAYLCICASTLAFACEKQLVAESVKEAKFSSRDLNTLAIAPGPPTGYLTTPLFVDDFNGTTYNTNNWFPRTGLRYNNTVENDANNLSVGNGILSIAIKKESDGRYTCGGVIAKKTTGYGYYEARMAIYNKSAGAHQSFWLMGTANAELVAADLAPAKRTVLEIDCVEADSRDAVAEYNYHTYIPTSKHPGGTGMGAYKTWYVAGFEWLPDRVKFYIDGEYKGQRVFSGDYDVYAAQNLWLTAQFITSCPYPSSDSRYWYDFGGHNNLSDPNARMQIDWIKYYPKFDIGVNMAGNNSFEYNKTTQELQDPMSWIETKSIPGYSVDASFVEKSSASRTGEYRLAHNSSFDYLTSTKQILSYIPNAKYKLTAWVKSSQHITPSRMRVLGFGGAERYVEIPASNEWVQITISDINVTNNEAVYAFTSTAHANEWIFVDDVKFERTQ